MQKKFMGLTLAAMLIFSVLMAIPSANFTVVAADGFTLEEAKKYPGVYIKDGDKFTPIRRYSQAIFVGSGIGDMSAFIVPAQSIDLGISNDAILFHEHDAQIPQIPYTAQLVLIGDTDIGIYQTFENGWTIPFMINLAMGINQFSYPHEGKSLIFETLNGEDPLNFQDRMVYDSMRVPFPYAGLLTGSRNEQYTFAGWSGTDWVETTIAADKRFFIVPKSREWSDWIKADYEIVKTLNGYFEINFLTPPSGFYVMSSGENLYYLDRIVEFVDPSSPPNGTNVGSISNFEKKNDYTSGMFTDVDENAWYSSVIATAYEYGLMRGNNANTFNPTGNITIAEAVTVASRVHSIYMTGKENFASGNPWYQPYVDYAVANGIIAAGDFTDYTRPATRAEMAYIFSRSLPTAEFAAQNTVNSLPDVNAGTKYYDAILTLYKAGVVAGSDAAGTFNPNANITRAEAAAIISRVVLPSTRMSGRTY